MSLPDVRTAARAMVNDASWPLDFYETINARMDRDTINDDVGVWCSLQFTPYRRRPMGSNCHREDGEITIMLFTPAGKSSDTEAQASFDLIEPLIDAWAWPAGFHQRTTPTLEEYDNEPDGMWMRWDVPITYTYDTSG